MLERREHTNLTLESQRGDGARQFRVENFDRDALSVCRIDRDIDAGTATATDLTLNRVPCWEGFEAGVHAARTTSTGKGGSLRYGSMVDAARGVDF